MNSRVFVGNLNTFQCSKTDVERMFQRYGRIAGKLYYQGRGISLDCLNRQRSACVTTFGAENREGRALVCEEPPILSLTAKTLRRRLTLCLFSRHFHA